MWSISITETGNHADIDIDHSIFRDTLPPPPSPPRYNIVPRMKKQAGSCVKNPYPYKGGLQSKTSMRRKAR